MSFPRALKCTSRAALMFAAIFFVIGIGFTLASGDPINWQQATQTTLIATAIYWPLLALFRLRRT
jgi:hypothetical protein